MTIAIEPQQTLSILIFTKDKHDHHANMTAELIQHDNSARYIVGS